MTFTDDDLKRLKMELEEAIDKARALGRASAWRARAEAYKETDMVHVYQDAFRDGFEQALEEASRGLFNASTDIRMEADKPTTTYEEAKRLDDLGRRIRQLKSKYP